MPRVVIADDEALARRVLRHMLSRLDVEVVGEAADGKQAVELFREKQPDVVILDVRMPGLSGLDAAEEIRSEHPNARILFISAYDEFKYAQKALSQGAYDYLLKPVDFYELARAMDAIRVVLDKDRQREQDEELVRKKLEMLIPLSEASFVNNLIFAHVTDGEQISALASFLGCTELPNAVMIANMDGFMAQLKTSSEAKREASRQAVYVSIKAFADLIGNCLIAPFGWNEFIILLRCPDSENVNTGNWAKRIACDLACFVKKKTKVDLSIGIGRTVPSPVHLGASYEDATFAERCRRLLDGRQTIHINDIVTQCSDEQMYWLDAEKRVISSIRDGDAVTACDTIRNLAFYFEELSTSEEAVNTILSEMVIVACRAAIREPERASELLPDKARAITCLENSTTIQDKLKCVVECVDRFSRYVAESFTSRVDVLLDQAEAFIRENCHENIALEDVSQYVNLSPSYLTRLLQQRSGMSFIKLLTQARMEKARLLLRDPDTKISQIAKRICYSSASYFSKVFKKEVGVSPIEYRESLIARMHITEAKKCEGNE